MQAPTAATRLQLTLACALFTAYWIFRSTIMDPPPEPTDSSWTFLPACPAGRFVWLTIHIDAAQLVYWSLLLVVESGALLNLEFPAAADMHWRLLATLHSVVSQSSRVQTSPPLLSSDCSCVLCCRGLSSSGR